MLVVDRPGEGDWVTIVLADGERWSTVDAEVFYSRGRAVHVVEGG